MSATPPSIATRYSVANRPPAVTARAGFEARWAEVHEDLTAGRLSRSQACTRLGIGYATLLRLLEAPPKEVLA
jgi:hypothetical protein